MGRTPDRSPGPALEEETQYSDQTTPAVIPGAVRYTNGAFSMRDSVGEFDPRVGAHISNHAGGESVSIQNGDEILYGTVSGLPYAPTHVVVGTAADTTSLVIDDDMTLVPTVLGLTADGFDYMLQVFDGGELSEWEGGTITAEFHYFWSE